MLSASEHIRGCGLDPVPILTLVELALNEDIGGGDVTSVAIFDRSDSGTFAAVAKSEGVMAGGPLAAAVFLTHDSMLSVELPVEDGAKLNPGDLVLRVTGSVRSVLEAERVALNLLRRLSGIATLTARYVRAMSGSGATLLDTRKTGLGTRPLDKYAVRCGGGSNHRIGLFDAVLVKDNHIAAAGSISAAVAALARHGWSASEIEVECDTRNQVEECLECGVGMILLDNMDPAEMAEIVSLVDGRCQLEASGKITLTNAAAAAASGVDYVSVGAITHSAPALDIGLDALE